MCVGFGGGDEVIPMNPAAYNMQIFGPVYVAGMLFALVRWLVS